MAGRTYTGISNQVLRYRDSATSDWTLFDAGDLTKRQASGSVSANGKVWLFGGLGASAADTSKSGKLNDIVTSSTRAKILIIEICFITIRSAIII